MTTARQIQQLVQPLLGRNTDIFYRKNWIYLKPIRNVVCFIKIERSGSADYCFGTGVVDFSFNNSNTAWGWPIGNPGELWTWGDPGLPALFIDRVEETLATMRGLRSLEAFAEFASRDRAFYTSPLHGHRDCQLRIDIALGRLDKALIDCRELHELFSNWPSDNYFGTLFRRVAVPALPLLESRDIAGLVELLRQWQARYLSLQNLDTIFEPEPFPLEALMKS
jgi:hypothetical protein